MKILSGIYTMTIILEGIHSLKNGERSLYCWQVLHVSPIFVGHFNKLKVTNGTKSTD